MGKNSWKFNDKNLLTIDDNLKRWYDNSFRSSPSAADARLRNVARFCRENNLTTQQLAKIGVKKSTTLLLDSISKYQERGIKSSSIEACVKSVKHFMEFNGVKITQKFRYPEDDPNRPSKTQQEQSPVPEQLRKLFNACDVKQRLECSLIAFSGVRPETLGDYTGKDGLRIMDFPEMMVDNTSKVVEFSKMPCMVIVRSSLSKAGHQYVTFLAEEGCTYLKENLEYRMKSLGQVMDKSTPIVSTLKYLKSKRYAHLATSNLKTNKISSSMRSAIRNAGYDWRPYILRTYFDTRLLMAEADRIIIKDWRTFWMGHKGDIEHVYTLNKRNLPEDLVEQMREAYAKASRKFMQTMRTMEEARSIDNGLARMNRQFLEIAGYSEQDLADFGDLAEYDAVTIRKLIREKQKQDLGLNGNSQKVVSKSEIKKYIADGWNFVGWISEEEAIISLPK